jgi:hypothetical protein
MINPVICRHCGIEFRPMPGKPGYIDECPFCLAERNSPPPNVHAPLVICPKKQKTLNDILSTILIWVLAAIAITLMFLNKLVTGEFFMPKLRERNGVMEKRCSCCGLWKPLTDFSPGGSSHGPSEGGKHCECHECNAKRHRDRYATARRIRRRE